MQSTIIIQYYKSPFGELILGSFQEKLCLCDWRYRKMRTAIDKRLMTGLNTGFQEGDSIIIEKAISQLTQYFKGLIHEFDLPLLIVGSEFQKKVWNELLKIPFGSTETYLGLSRKLGNQKAIRAVASANGANAISIIIPCHRIIGKNGDLVGYAGGLEVKKKLLNLECALDNSQLHLF